MFTFGVCVAHSSTSKIEVRWAQAAWKCQPDVAKLLLKLGANPKMEESFLALQTRHCQIRFV